MKNSFVNFIKNLDRLGRTLIRFSIVLVFLWIGMLKFFDYEADRIVPFVANSPFMSFFYKHQDEYRAHQNKEGELLIKNHQWHIENNTYSFSHGLGVFLITVAVLIALNNIFPFAGMVGRIRVFLMTIGTISFLNTTPESLLPHLT